MVKRQLNTDEIMLCNKTLKQRKLEQEWFDYQLKFHKLMLDEGLKANYDKTVTDYKTKEQDFKNQSDMNKQAIKIIQDQMRNGVEVKEDVDIKDNEEGGSE